MIKSNLPRVKIRTQCVPSCSRLIYIKTNNIPRKIRTRGNTSDLRPPRSITQVPKAKGSQFVSDDAVKNSKVMTYEQINDLLDEDVLKKEDSPFRFVLLKFLELELLKISVLRFDQIHKLVPIMLRIRRGYRHNVGLKEYLEQNLSNIAIKVFRLIYNPRYMVSIMNEHIKLLMQEDISNETKIDNIYKILDISCHIKSQFEKMEVPHDVSLNISYTNSREIMKILDRESYLEFFMKLLEYNCTSISSKVLGDLRYALKNGAPHEQEIYEFDVLLSLDDSESMDFLKKKFLTLYSFSMIKDIVVKYIQNGDSEKSEFYLEYFLAKYAMEKSNAETKEKEQELTTTLYEIVTYHSVRLKNYQSAIGLLETIIANNIPITPKLLHILTTSFRKKKMFDAVLTVLNKTTNILKDQEVDNNFKNLLAGELIITLREKFPDNPKLVVSQFLSIYQGSELMLNQLGLLSLIYNDIVAEIGDLNSALPTLYKTEVSDFFKINNGFPNIENMTELYILILNYIGMHQNGDHLQITLTELFNKFRDYVMKVQELSVPNHPFSKDFLDEGILNVFVKRTIMDAKRPELAFSFLKSFLQSCDFKRFDGYAASMIIYFDRYIESYKIDELIAILKKLNSPLGFYAITALILRKDKSMDYEEAHAWYKKLLELKEPINHFGLIQVIKKHEWELPEDFDHSLLKTEYMTSEERKEIEMLAQDDETLVDPEFIGRLSHVLDSTIPEK